MPINPQYELLPISGADALTLAKVGGHNGGGDSTCISIASLQMGITSISISKI